ncbi:2,3,4,5-tetrahydropyridine-2,6-dicarboxylate N-succinyltransferase [Botrimarina sp.]|uniref:2,3,4,5-tetrahydropyridine-2,6-dicarboxylate N-succinyltransferase n=1 Tax=Botrimarina sp. TaxID=2795802 RepID=UPI0032EB07AC
MTDIQSLAERIDKVWADEEAADLGPVFVKQALDLLDAGEVRVAEKRGGQWVVNEWVKKAVLLHFRFTNNREMTAGPIEWFDKVGLKTGWEQARVRSVPTAIARYGSFIEPDAVLMPCYVNIGARVGSGTMIDTWSTVGSCAQVGKNCHISGGVGIGGVLEPLQANPVIIEDDVFLGARSEVAEGVIVEEGAVLAMGCFLAQSTKVYSVPEGRVIEPGRIPARSVCVPGSLASKDGSHHTYAIIIKKQRDAKTDARTALTSILREGPAVASE